MDSSAIIIGQVAHIPILVIIRISVIGIVTDDVALYPVDTEGPQGTDGTQQGVGKHVVATVKKRGDDFGQFG